MTRNIAPTEQPAQACRRTEVRHPRSRAVGSKRSILVVELLPGGPGGGVSGQGGQSACTGLRIINIRSWRWTPAGGELFGAVTTESSIELAQRKSWACAFPRSRRAS
jgi:hypothetical protein